MKNKVFLIIIILVVITIAVIPWGKMDVFSFFSKKPPEPENKYGEFPFKLIYDINGKTTIIEDTLVIEHKGVDWNEGLGKYNKWKTYYKSEKVNASHSTSGNLILFNDYVEGVGSVIITFELGSCEHYMGLEEVQSYYEYFGIKAGDIVMKSPSYTGPITDDDLYKKFKIKIIEKSVSEPIIKKTD